MENFKINQEHINKYVATTEDFWLEFYQSLSAPYSIWKKFKDKTYKECINECRSSKQMIQYLNFLFQYPVLKGEYLITYASGMVLTNYRLLVKDDSAGNPSIPLINVLEYNENGEIKYKKNGETLNLQYSEFLNYKYVNSAKSRNEAKNLSQEQVFIIENSLFELKKYNSELVIPEITIPEHQDTTINVKIKIDTLTQEKVDNYIVNTEIFWHEFHKSLNNSHSIWNAHKDETFEKWVIMCWNTKDMIEHFNFLFKFPMLKGEYPIAYANGMILTNYRLVINDSSNNNPSIPLTKIKKYSLQEGGIIEIEIENQTEKLRYNEMLNDEIVNPIINSCKKNGLEELQEKLITNSVSDLKQDFPNLTIPKIEMFPLSEEQKVELVKYKKAVKRSGDISEIISAIVLIGIAVLIFFIFFGGDSCKGHELDIKKGQIETAEKMGMIVNSISVEYIGNCEYKCVSDVYDPGTAFSRPQHIKSTDIYKWDGNDYYFVRSE